MNAAWKILTGLLTQYKAPSKAAWQRTLLCWAKQASWVLDCSSFPWRTSYAPHIPFLAPESHVTLDSAEHGNQFLYPYPMVAHRALTAGKDLQGVNSQDLPGAFPG